MEFPATKPSPQEVTCCNLLLWGLAGSGSPGSPARLVGRPIGSDKSQHLLQMMWLINTCLIINFEPVSLQWAGKLSERSYCSNPFFFCWKYGMPLLSYISHLQLVVSAEIITALFQVTSCVWDPDEILFQVEISHNVQASRKLNFSPNLMFSLQQLGL